MSTSRVIPLPGGREARMHYTPGPILTQASALVFDADARVIFDGPTTGYNGYCYAEIAASVLRPLADAGTVTEDEIADAVAGVFGEVCVCPCECDDTECPDCNPDDDDAPAGGVIESPRWPDGCPLTLDELANIGAGHVHTPDTNGTNL